MDNVNPEPLSKDTGAGEKEPPGNWNRIVRWIKTTGVDWGLFATLLTAAFFISILSWDLAEVKEDVESMRARVIRMETMTEGMRGYIRDVHRDAAYIKGHLGRPGLRSEHYSTGGQNSTDFSYNF